MKLIAQHLSLTSAGFDSGSKQQQAEWKKFFRKNKKSGKTPPDFWQINGVNICTKQIQTQCVRRAAINKDISAFFPFFSPRSWLFFHLSPFASFRSWGVKFRSKTRKKNLISSLSSWKKTFSHLSAGSPYCPDTCFFPPCRCRQILAVFLRWDNMGRR